MHPAPFFPFLFLPQYSPRSPIKLIHGLALISLHAALREGGLCNAMQCNAISISNGRASNGRAGGGSAASGGEGFVGLLMYGFGGLVGWVFTRCCGECYC